MIKYIELKSGFSNDGPACIGIVKTSKSGKTIYFNDKALVRGNGMLGNHFDIETGEEYWISNIKKNGEDRHWSGAGKIKIETAVVPEYLKIIGAAKLNMTKFIIVESFKKTDISRFEAALNERVSF